MASHHELELSNNYSDRSDDDMDEDEEEQDNIEEEEQEDDNSNDYNICSGRSRRGGLTDFFSWKVIDPRAPWVQEWNRVFLLVCATGLFVDPLFFYALSISETCMCLFIDGWFAVTVTVLRCMTDAMHLWNMWIQFKMHKLRPYDGKMDENRISSSSRGSQLHQDQSFRCFVALRYLKSKKGFFFDLFVILPLPQIVMWVGIPGLLEKGYTTTVMTVLLIMFLFQYLPKIYHSVCLLRRMQNLSGYIFGTVWWGIALNLIAYFVASHAVGACWYLLGIQRAAKCLKQQCRVTNGCSLSMLACEEQIFYGTSNLVKHKSRVIWGETKIPRSTCLASEHNFDYGVYKWTVQLVTNENRFEKILFPIFWGLMTLSTFGNLESTTDWLEDVFIIIVLTTGLLLVTMLIGNIKVFLHATTSKKQAMQLKMRNVEWWMRRRRLPQGFKQRVRNYERHRFAATRGVDEYEMISNLPEGLRRDIKYHLCLDLVRQVPLFQHMDNLVLENICDRVKSLIFTKGETITREGDPVQRMLFIVRGHLQSSQELREGVKSCCMLGPGNFSGDELLSWCLRKPFVERLPPSSSSLETLETTEAFGLEADDVKYVTQHFRYTFVNEKVKRSARYYSPGWRTWAAVAIQLAWRRYRHRLTLTSLSFIRPRRPLSRSSSLTEDRLRLYTALLTSPKPNQDDFDF
ncbi:cyclic nucleotide-gated ion channel 4-like [Solanum stenotomum]|uniref:cyclic nucleotide-gated ion channel 4-like n=1 Tax=Solanum stenotomum TaxID=172797 RepID=UPI0020D1F000|nr:cyclic nucleotide-gated ion channel 4-like [Solanum stenotomum]